MHNSKEETNLQHRSYPLSQDQVEHLTRRLKEGRKMQGARKAEA